MLFEHNLVSEDGENFTTVNYVATQTTARSYIVDEMGTISAIVRLNNNNRRADKEYIRYGNKKRDGIIPVPL
jgi:hypothetical protein